MFITGTLAQLVAVVIVVMELVQHPDPAAKTEIVVIKGQVCALSPLRAARLEVYGIG